MEKTSERGEVTMMHFLNMIIGYLDMVLVKGSELGGLQDNKHVLFACRAVIYYEDEIVAAAAKSETTFDDAIVAEVLQAAKQIAPDPI